MKHLYKRLKYSSVYRQCIVSTQQCDEKNICAFKRITQKKCLFSFWKDKFFYIQIRQTAIFICMIFHTKSFRMSRKSQPFRNGLLLWHWSHIHLFMIYSQLSVIGIRFHNNSEAKVSELLENLLGTTYICDVYSMLKSLTT